MKKNIDLIFAFLLFGILLLGFVLGAGPVWIGADINYSVTEDTPYYHDLRSNISEYSTEIIFDIDTETNISWTNASGTFSFEKSEISWISILDSTIGNLSINATTDDETGFFVVPIQATNTTSEDASVTNFEFIVNATNDAPEFVNLINRSFNMTELFEYIVNITDEENNIPFNLTLNFSSCGLAEWSDRANCTLFLESQYSFNDTSGVLNISFTPTRNDVGSYIINFSVVDNSTISPKNQTASQLVNFTVLNLNTAPYFRYTCDNERSATEDTEFTCRINVTDIDEVINLTFVANHTWFTFNGTGINSTTMAVNSSTSFNASAFVNFTTTDAAVGNWSVNISVTDTGSPSQVNSTVFWFYVDNINDSVLLDQIDNKTAYTSNNYTIYVNATDNDLLIPDESVYNEVLTFSSNDSDVNITGSEISGTNKTRATITFDPNDLGVGNHSVNISVNDSNGYSLASQVFVIEVFGNNPPVWNETTKTNHSLVEDIEFYFNLSQNVSDSEGDSINFTFVNDTAFYSFNASTFNLTGIINFTPIDEDIGQHIIIISASDGVTPTQITFNFTINNTNDLPVIETPLTVVNATIGGVSNDINISEDNYTTITLWVQDDDVRIPSGQKIYYNETFTLNLTINGTNPNLFSFTKTDDFPVAAYPNRTEYEAIFTPSQSDIGSYNITINITDSSNASTLLVFNLTVFNTQDTPTITEIADMNSSIIESIYVNVNSTDDEDGDDSSENLTFSYDFTEGTNFIDNETIFNTTTGELNITFNSSHGGAYTINISVNDTDGYSDSFMWNLTVYDYPQIISPNISIEFNFKENASSILNFTVNHSVQDNLTYTILVNNIIRNSTSGYGNQTEFLWGFTPNFTDETTCSGVVNLTLNVSNAKLSNSTSWNVTINHTNYPLTFSNTIPNTTSTTPIILSSYFTDIDASDSCRNQTIGFTYNVSDASGGTITVGVVNYTNGTTPSIDFSSTSTGSANYSVNAYEYNTSSYSSPILRSVSSNNFSVLLTIVTTTTPVSGGGGGGGTTIVSLKIILPDPVSAYKKDQIILPITLHNDGSRTLFGISLTGLIAKDGLVRDDVTLSFDQSNISSLSAGEKKNVTLTIDVNTQEQGLFEITINATVKSPKYNDWSKLYLTIDEGEDALERLLFTEEFILDNPECAELTELVNEAREYFKQGDFVNTVLKVNQAIDACKEAISQQGRARFQDRFENKLYVSLLVATLFSFFMGVSYYTYRRIKLRRFSQGNLKLKENI